MWFSSRRVALAGALLAGATLLSPAAAAPSAPPAPGLGIRLLEAPTARADDPRARTYVVDRVAPGASFTRKFEVTNGDASAMDVRLYPAAAVVRGGAFSVQDFGVAGEFPSWAKVEPATLTIPPGGRATARVTVAVDPKAAESEYYGAVVAERLAKPVAGGVAVNLRAGIRVYLSVGPGGEPPSDFTIDSLTAARDATGKPVVRASVHNTGGRALDMSGTLRLTGGPGGLSAGPFNATLGTTLAVGETEPVTVTLDGALPAGPWKARLDLQSGLTRRGATATITFPDRGEAAPVDATLVEDDSAPPWPLLAAGVAALLVLAGLVLFFLKRRGRGSDDTQAEPAA